MNSVFHRLKARKLGSGSADTASAMQALGREFTVSLPKVLFELLSEIGGPVVFDAGARFKAAERVGREDSNGDCHLEMLYGLCSGQNGLLNANRTYQEQLPPGFLVIGDAPGGDQICMATANGSIAYWRHDSEFVDDLPSLIARDFDAFKDLLEPEPNQPATDLESKIVGCRLDF